MNVKLISLTEGSQLLPIGSNDETKLLNPEELIVYTARVSNPGNQNNSDTSAKLIAYLVKNKHWSPFEMASMTVEIVTSRAIAQQILRHRSFSFQEFYQRYAEVTEMESVQIRKQADKNRQSSTDVFDPEVEIDFDIDANTCFFPASKAIKNHLEKSQTLYKALIKAGVAKECARMVLPLTTQTTIYMQGSVRSWIHYLQIRCDEHVQLEHRQIAECIRLIFMERFPNIAEALGWEVITVKG